MVDADQQVLAQAFDLAAQLGELFATPPVAPKQNHAADQGVLQALAISFSERKAGDVDDEGGVLGHDEALLKIWFYGC